MTIIDTFKEADLEEVLVLHEIIFSPLGCEAYAIVQEEFRENLRAKRVFAAYAAGKVVGFGGYRLMHDDHIMRASVQTALSWAKDKDNEPLLLEMMRQEQEQLGKGEASVTIYENELTQKGVEVLDNDMYFSELGVHPEFRRRGVGEALTHTRIKIARELNCSAIYVSCWEAGHVSKMYEKLGFFPILRGEPRYNDGHAEKVMGLLLK